MFMVASSVVTTIMILNYHHRQADTHKMPEWVASHINNFLQYKLCYEGEDAVSSVDSLAVENVQARRKADQEDHHDAEQDEGAGSQGDVFQIAVGQCS